MIRSTLSVLIGYGVFALSAVVLFEVTGVDPHAPGRPPFRTLAIAYGAAFGLVAGYFAASIGGQHGRRSSRIVAAIVGLSGLMSLVARPGEGAIWTQVSSILIFAPLVLLGGRLKKSPPP